MKILYDHQMFDAQAFGGISRYFVNLIIALDHEADNNAEVSVLFTNNYYLKGKRGLSLDNLIGNTFFSKKSRVSKWNRNYSKYCLMKDDFDLFHPTYYNPYFLKFSRKPFVITVHDMIYELYPEFFNPDDFTAQYKKNIITLATHIIAISHTTKKDLMEILQIPEEKITVVYHGHTSTENEKESDLFLPERYILFVGGRDNYKNFIVFSRAAALVMQKDLTLNLVCAGGGKFTLVEQEHLKMLGILDRTIQYNVTDEDLYWVYKKACAFVFPSLYEGFGLPVLEAFDSGCPVVLSNTPSFLEVAGDAAIYFDPADFEQMAQCIQDLLANVSLQQSIVSKGKVRLKNFTMEKCVSQTIDVYRKCLKG